jgi:hypothetical protein
MINEPCEIRTQPLGIYLFPFYIEGPMIGALTRCLIQSLVSLLKVHWTGWWSAPVGCSEDLGCANFLEHDV